MIVDVDSKGNISIMEIRPEEAELLVDAICSLFADKSLHTRTQEEKAIVNLKRELEKLY